MFQITQPLYYFPYLILHIDLRRERIGTGHLALLQAHEVVLVAAAAGVVEGKAPGEKKVEVALV